MIPADNFEYVGFGWRVLAALVDAAIGFALMPVSITLMNYSWAHRTIIPGIAHSVIWTVFWMWLIVKFGATPGKMVIKARIVNANGEFLNWQRAFMRMLFPGLLISINSLLQRYHAMNAAPPEASINTFWEVGRAINQYGYPFLRMFGMFLGLTVYIDVLVVLLNKRKRAIHDFIAGSFVVKKDSLTKTVIQQPQTRAE